ncbi:MAG: Phosphoglycolate phosphatase [Candidatus Scalindua rubra]|uniref:Phosphoglycolate phosphatase n=1 Tax=Candidatus Scalindua rubra TaxID=1872076 RepID=A0A1E3X742_9BACT|nr:MAG: Phosphoglycolate phosphatase [Candidatus Scalindua rubra]
MVYAGARNAYEFLNKQDVDMPPYEDFFQKVQSLFSDLGNSKKGGIKDDIKSGDMKNKVQTLLEEINVEISAEMFKKLINEWYQPFARELDIYEDSESTLKALRQKGFRLVAVTNTAWSGELIEGDLRRFGVASFFEAVIVSSDIGYRKPSPVIFERALRELGLDASECIFVGDSIIEDIQGAQQMGMRAILKGKNHHKVAGIIPDAEVVNLYEIIEFLEDDIQNRL